MSIKNIGTLLREKRLALGLSMKDVASALKVQYHSLEKIEEGSIDLGDVYTLGYIRNYSKYLGVNLNTDFVEKHSNVISKKDKNDHDNSLDRKTSGNDAPSIRVVGVTFLVVILSVIFVVFFSGSKDLDNANVFYVNKLHISSENKLAVKEDGQTYVVNSTDKLLMIKAYDSVEVTVMGDENVELGKLNLRDGEALPLPVQNKSVTVRTNVPYAIEIIEKK